MAVVRQLVKFATYPIAMGAGVALCLWVLLGPLRVDRLAVPAPVPPATPALPIIPDPSPSPTPALPVVADPPPPAAPALPVVPDTRLARPSGRIASAAADFPLVAGDRGPLVTQMQGALIAKGYGVGLAGADGDFNDDTLTALGAFQDNNALPVQPTCDQACWTTLGLLLPK
jgi:hypothetical protein